MLWFNVPFCLPHKPSPSSLWLTAAAGTGQNKLFAGQQADDSPAENGGLSAPFDEADFSDPSAGAPNGIAPAPYNNASGVRSPVSHPYTWRVFFSKTVLFVMPCLPCLSRIPNSG